MFTLFKKDFNFLRFGGLLLLLSILLISGFNYASAAPGVDTLGAQAKLVVNLSNKAVMDSVIMPTFQIVISDTLTTTSDSVRISFASGKFLFAKSGPYPVLVNAVNGMTADSARVNAAGTQLFIKVSGPTSSTVDTLTISGVYMKGSTASGIAYSDSTTHDSLSFAIGRTATGFSAGAHPGAGVFVLLPGPIYTAAIVTQPASTIAAGSSLTAALTFLDRWSNVPNDKTTAITVAAQLIGGAPGNGTLSSTVATRTPTLGHPGTDTLKYSSLKYTKAEAIQIVFTAPGNTVISNTVTVTAGAVVNISVALVSGNSDTITVDQTTAYTLTVTDQFFNPINNQVVSAAENTSHAATFAAISNTNTSGQTTATFSPSKFFVGPDTLKFTAGSVNQLHPILINPGVLGGVITDYAGTSTGAGSTEPIAVGTPIFVHAFFRDSYGNPINITDTGSVAFSIDANTKKHGGVLTQSGKALVSISAANASITYSKPLVSAVTAMAIPYTVSDTIGNKDAVTLLTKSGGYTVLVNTLNSGISLRSNVPASAKLAQLGAGDSSMVASNYSNTITFVDSVWDQYGNVVSYPTGTAPKIAPLQPAYAMILSTSGKAKFTRTNDTTAADTNNTATTATVLLNGVLSRTVSSSKVAGLDTLKVVYAGNAAVSKTAPIWVTPAAFAKLAIAPHADTTAIAGRVDIFTVEKQDANGNHIDWGLAGGNARGNTGAVTVPTTGQIAADSTSLIADTVSSGHNRGGKVAKLSKTGTAGAASVGGTLNLRINFTPYTVTADTQKIYASLGGFNDTVLVRSIPTGSLASFTVVIAAGDTVKNAGDSVKVTITALDIVGNQVYTYSVGGQTFTVNNTSVAPITSLDTTYYFTYVNSAGKYVKSTGVSIADTAFATSTGQAILYLHKFTAEPGFNTVTATAATVTATSTVGTKFKAITAVGQNTWTVVASRDTVGVNNLFSYTVYPRDKYDNLNTTEVGIVNVSANTGNNFNGGTNPKIVVGQTTFNATELAATTPPAHLIIYVTDNLTPPTLLGQRKSIKAIVGVSVETPKVLPTVYALEQNYPNPFNPTTNIAFDIPQNSSVKIAIYDMLGREVATLVNANYTPGHYTVPFNASQLASGMYIYRMTSQSASGDQKLFTSTKKLLLVK